MTKPYRAWVNQPSTHQPLHELHGTRVIAYDERDPGSVTIYFLQGEAESWFVPKRCISRGWPPHTGTHAAPQPCQHTLDEHDICTACGEDLSVHLALKGAGLL